MRILRGVFRSRSSGGSGCRDCLLFRRQGGRSSHHDDPPGDRRSGGAPGRRRTDAARTAGLAVDSNRAERTDDSRLLIRPGLCRPEGRRDRSRACHPDRGQKRHPSAAGRRGHACRNRHPPGAAWLAACDLACDARRAAALRPAPSERGIHQTLCQPGRFGVHRVSRHTIRL